MRIVMDEDPPTKKPPLYRNKMKVLYRISNGGNAKQKPEYVYNKKRMFLHFLSVFKDNDIYVFADNVSEDLYQFLLEHHDPDKLFRFQLGNARSFMKTVDFAMERFSDNTPVYFAEDDYVYRQNAPEIIEEGLTVADYSTGYDHPDKYINHNEGGPNPFIEQGGELTRVLVSKNIHWKQTNSTCMTFATTLKTIKQDYAVFAHGCSSNIPTDFRIFCDLRQYQNRTLVSCIPAVSTHGETEWLAKFVDWDAEILR